MRLPTTTLSGAIVFPDGSVPEDGSKLQFALSTFETDDATVLPEPVIVSLDQNGEFSVPLWPSARGSRGSFYTVTATLKAPSAKPRTVTLGNITVPEQASVVLEDLLASYVAPTQDFDPVATNISQGARTATTVVVSSSTGQNATLSAATTELAGMMAATDKAKLDQIEAAATADQTGAEIKAAYEAVANTNAFTDAEKTKLSGLYPWVQMTQAAYDAISPDPATLYVIVG